MNTVQSSFPRNWSELPGDLLALIIEKFICTSSLSGYIRFGAVCRSWRSIFTRENYEHIELTSRLPMLLFLYPLHIKNDDKSSTESFYSISEKKVYDFQLHVPHHHKKYVGSSHGWLITVDYDNKDHYFVKLLNPFRSFNNVITLPPLTKHVHIITLKKFVLSADPWPSSSSKPADDDVVVMGISSYDWLGYCRLGDKVWTSVVQTCTYQIHDVIYYKGLFYAAMEKGFMVALDVGLLHPLQKPKVTLISPNTTHDSLKPGERAAIYLVECSGELLQVCRVYSGVFQRRHTVWTICFEVYKQYIDDDHDSVRRVQVRDLNGYSFFLGVNASISVKAADFPGCKPDCIYFTGERSYRDLWPRNMGVFCLLDESFESHYPLNPNKAIMPPPIWIQPTTQISDLIKLITIN